ncbi:hypothetical protein [Streptomyces sp. MK7]|uniref:hypothetical protein n=1 Tax=Streptomyces sp. MK7 TaxID=3067635 RepID=UPI0029309C4D|nr:hypothetical protein [Streptomyces sp. MK7]
MPISAFTVLLSTRIVVDSVGVRGYALYALVVTLPSLIPGDLGTLSAIVDGGARSPAGNFIPLREAVISSARVLKWAALIGMVAGVVPAFLGGWSKLLGHAAAPGADPAVAAAFTLFGCSLFLGLGNSVLIALNRAHLTLLLQIVGSVLTLVLLFAAATIQAPLAAYVAAGFLAQCTIGAVRLVLAGRIIGTPLLRVLMRSLCTRHYGPRILNLAAPTAVINTCFTLIYSSDRLILSHMSGTTAVAAYSAAAQMFAPATTLITATGLPLWSIFAQQRYGSRKASSPREVALLTGHFALGGLILGLALILIGPMVGSWMMHDRAEVDAGLMTAFAALLLVQAACQPLGLWLTDAAGLLFQARNFVVMAVANFALSIPLARALGAPGPVIGSATALTIIVFVPSFRRSVFRVSA